MRTQVAIVGAGPAGMLLSQLLHLQGIDSVVLERRSREYVQQRVRAGVLEQGTVDVLRDADVAERLEKQGHPHHGVNVQFDGERLRIPLSELTGGRTITVYGQQEVVKDLADRRERDGGRVHYEVSDVSVDGIDTEQPVVRFTSDGSTRELHCDYVAGCDGFHGVCRNTVPDSVRTNYERVYPFGWLGILAEVPPSSEELIYSNHPNGFALHSLRSSELSRLYLQCDPRDPIEQWPDERIWEELQTRLGTPDWKLREGPVVDKNITALRSFVTEPMSYGRLFPGRGLGAHRPAHRGEGAQPRRGRCGPAGARAHRPLPQRQHHGAGHLLPGVPASRVAGAALLLVDDFADAPLRRSGLRLRPAVAALPVRLPALLGRRGHEPRRELRGPGRGLTRAVLRDPSRQRGQPIREPWSPSRGNRGKRRVVRSAVTVRRSPFGNPLRRGSPAW